MIKRKIPVHILPFRSFPEFHRCMRSSLLARRSSRLACLSSHLFWKSAIPDNFIQM